MAKEFVIAKTTKEAASYLRKGAALLAGGTEVNRLESSVSANTLVSIGRIQGLDGISKSGKSLKLGSMCTFQELVDCEKVPDYLKKACLFMSSRTRRNMATIGGNIASMRDDSYLLATLLACGAKLTVLKAGKEVTVPLESYVKDAKVRKYLILSVTVPSEGCVASKRYANTAASHSYLTVSASKKGKAIRLGICAKNSGIYCCEDYSSIMNIKFKTDMFGSKEYKKYLLDVTSVDLINEVKGDDK